MIISIILAFLVHNVFAFQQKSFIGSPVAESSLQTSTADDLALNPKVGSLEAVWYITDNRCNSGMKKTENIQLGKCNIRSFDNGYHAVTFDCDESGNLVANLFESRVSCSGPSSLEKVYASENGQCDSYNDNQSMMLLWNCPKNPRKVEPIILPKEPTNPAVILVHIMDDIAKRNNTSGGTRKPNPYPGFVDITSFDESKSCDLNDNENHDIESIEMDVCYTNVMPRSESVKFKCTKESGLRASIYQNYRECAGMYGFREIVLEKNQNGICEPSIHGRPSLKLEWNCAGDYPDYPLFESNSTSSDFAFLTENLEPVEDSESSISATSLSNIQPGYAHVDAYSGTDKCDKYKGSHTSKSLALETCYRSSDIYNPFRTAIFTCDEKNNFFMKLFDSTLDCRGSYDTIPFEKDMKGQCVAKDELNSMTIDWTCGKTNSGSSNNPYNSARSSVLFILTSVAAVMLVGAGFVGFILHRKRLNKYEQVPAYDPVH